MELGILSSFALKALIENLIQVGKIIRPTATLLKGGKGSGQPSLALIFDIRFFTRRNPASGLLGCYIFILIILWLYLIERTAKIITFPFGLLILRMCP